MNLEQSSSNFREIGLSDIKRKMVKEHRRDLLKRIFSNRLIVFGGIIVIIFTLIAILSPIIAPYSPLEGKGVDRYKPPSSQHIFGTDEYGRDVFTRTIYGTQISLIVGFSVAIVTSIFGMIIGLLSTYYRRLDHLFMRINDAVMSFPEILLAIAIMASLGARVSNVVLATSIVYIPHVARVIRARAMVVREQTYIEAMKALGARPFRIIWLHIAPNCIPPLIVQASFVFALSILIEAMLSFLGAGTPASIPSLGNIISDGKIVLNEAWWMTVFPGMFIILLVLGFYMLGDGLSEILDPHAKKNK